MNEKHTFEDWKELILKAEDYYNQQINFGNINVLKDVYNTLDNTQMQTLKEIHHWLKVINNAGTMTDITLSHMKYGQPGDDSYSIKLLIQEIDEILENDEYSDNQKDYLNGLYKWYSDNNKNLIKSYN